MLPLTKRLPKALMFRRPPAPPATELVPAPPEVLMSPEIETWPGEAMKTCPPLLPAPPVAVTAPDEIEPLLLALMPTVPPVPPAAAPAAVIVAAKKLPLLSNDPTTTPPAEPIPILPALPAALLPEVVRFPTSIFAEPTVAPFAPVPGRDCKFIPWLLVSMLTCVGLPLASCPVKKIPPPVGLEQLMQPFVVLGFARPATILMEPPVPLMLLAFIVEIGRAHV